MAVGANINQFLRSHKNDNFESFCMLWFIDVVICSDLRRSSFLKDFHFAIKRYQRELANNANLILASSSFTNTDRFEKCKKQVLLWFSVPKNASTFKNSDLVWNIGHRKLSRSHFQRQISLHKWVSKLKVHCLSFRCFRNNKEH